MKDNQPTLRHDLEPLFDPGLVAFAGRPEALDVRTATTVEKGHGCLEERTITVSSLLKEYTDWPSLEQVFQVTYQTTDMITGEIRTAVRYGSTSQPPEVAGPRTLLAQVRSEWGIETGLHGRRDGTLREDATYPGGGSAPQVLAALNNTVVGLALKHGYTNLSQARRAWEDIINKCLHVLAVSWSTEDFDVALVLRRESCSHKQAML